MGGLPFSEYKRRRNLWREAGSEGTLWSDVRQINVRCMIDK